jgi:hypothetical protein
MRESIQVLGTLANQSNVFGLSSNTPSSATKRTAADKLKAVGQDGIPDGSKVALFRSGVTVRVSPVVPDARQTESILEVNDGRT